MRRLPEVWFVSRTGTIRSPTAINDPYTGSTTVMHDPTYALSISVIGKTYVALYLKRDLFRITKLLRSAMAGHLYKLQSKHTSNSGFDQTFMPCSGYILFAAEQRVGYQISWVDLECEVNCP